MRSTSLFAIFALSVFTAGCPKEEKKTESEPEKKSAAASSEPEAEKKPAKKSKPEPDEPAPNKAKSGAHTVGGVPVPAFAKQSHPGKCTLDKSQKEKLASLQKGDDGGAGFDDGKGDVEAIVADIKKTCPSAGALVSQALNAGGYSRYAKKEYAKADGWFARALVADPANAFARYNLACNLALHGEKDEALYNVEQLVPAGKAGDARAVYYLDKATKDSDLNSVKKDPRFLAAISAPLTPGLAPCPPGLVHQGADKECIRPCASYGAQAGCPAGQACVGATSFGDSLVPYCADTFKCKDGEERMVVIKDGEAQPEPNAKPACFVECSADSDCGKGKTCSGSAGLPTQWGGWMNVTVCK